MLNRCKSNSDCYEEHYRKSVRFINGRWIIGILCFIIFLLLTYGFWGKPYPIQDLISVGMGFASIFLAVFAIFYSFTENLKTSKKESKVDNLLFNIEKNVETVHDVLGQVKNITNVTNTKVGVLEEFIRNVERQTLYEPKQEEQEGTRLKSEQKHKREARPEQQIKQERRPFSSIKRGNVYLASIDESNTIRPVIVFSNNIINKYSPQISVIPMTANIRIAEMPTHVFIEALERPSFALVELFSTMKKSQLGEHLATLDSTTIARLEKAFMVLIGEAGKEHGCN